MTLRAVVRETFTVKAPFTYRAVFLIIFGAAIYHASPGATMASVGLIGYGIFSTIDAWLAKRAKGAMIDDILHGWEEVKDEPEFEEKDGWRRLRLTGKEIAIVGRIAEMLWRMP